MTKKQAQSIAKVMEAMGAYKNSEDYQVKIISNYSGKAMEGKKTYGIVMKTPLKLMQALVTFPNLLCDDQGNPEIKNFNLLAIDLYGLDFIIY